MSRSLKRGLTGDRILVDTDKNIEFYPLFDRILVRLKKTRDVTAGGIIVPDSAKTEETMGEVVAVGYGAFDDAGRFVEREPIFHKGDIVVFKEYTGLRITLHIDDKPESFLILYDRDVLGVMRKGVN
jgi:chaperonin GroES